MESKGRSLGNFLESTLASVSPLLCCLGGSTDASSSSLDVVLDGVLMSSSSRETFLEVLFTNKYSSISSSEILREGLSSCSSREIFRGILSEKIYFLRDGTSRELYILLMEDPIESVSEDVSIDSLSEKGTQRVTRKCSPKKDIHK